jgi:hypothetical protein
MWDHIAHALHPLLHPLIKYIGKWVKEEDIRKKAAEDLKKYLNDLKEKNNDSSIKFEGPNWVCLNIVEKDKTVTSHPNKKGAPPKINIARKAIIDEIYQHISTGSPLKDEIKNDYTYLVYGIYDEEGRQDLLETLFKERLHQKIENEIKQKVKEKSEQIVMVLFWIILVAIFGGLILFLKS